MKHFETYNGETSVNIKTQQKSNIREKRGNNCNGDVGLPNCSTTDSAGKRQLVRK